MPGVNENAILTPQDNNGVNKLFITAEETQNAEESKIEGKIPSYIVGGSYIRVGPCKFDFKDFTVNHWIDGYALLSKFEIKSDDSISLEKKFVQSDAYKKAIALGKPAINEFATRAQYDEKKSFFSRVISSLLPEFTDNPYSTLYRLGQDLFATCDTQYFHKIHPSILNSECKCDANKAFGVNGQCAHPVTDLNGDVYNAGFSMGATGIKYHLIKIPFAKTSDEMIKNAKVIASLPPRWSGKLGTTHSFGMTENYFVFAEQPYTVSTKRIAASFVKGDTLKDWLEWKPEDKNRFYLIEKSTGKVIKTEFLTTKAFYYLHFINCYEENNQIVVDIVIYDSPNIMDTMMIRTLREDSVDFPFDLPYIQRFVIPIIPDLKGANVRENLNLVTKPGSGCIAMRDGAKILITGEKICGYGMDLPSTNKRYFGRRTKYVYAAGTFHEHDFSNTLCKVDLDTKEVWRWKHSDYTHPGEPCFVPNPKGSSEDDGVVISAVTDKRLGHEDFLVVLDAKNMKELGRAPFNCHIPASMHGIFLPN